MALLELQGIVAGYVDGIDILNGVIRGGARHRDRGHRANGAGKSTLLKTIFGSSLHGRAGSPGRARSPGAAPHDSNAGIGYVRRAPTSSAADGAREPRLAPGCSATIARASPRCGARLRRLPRLREKRRLRATVSPAAKPRCSQSPRSCDRAELLLVDEPSAGLAPRIAEQVYERLREVQRPA